MVDETNVNEEKQWYYEQRAKTVIDNLKKKKLDAYYVSNRKEALATIMEMIPEETVIGRGDSVTMEQIGVIDELRKRDRNKIIEPYKMYLVMNDPNADLGQAIAECRRVQREALLSDIFLTGANAVTLDGKLVSTDAGGNRVAATIFGPKKVIIAVGANKIVSNLDAALERIHNVAAPLNAKRHQLKHGGKSMAQLPCVHTGNCMDCSSEHRLCNYTTIIEGSSFLDRGRINVVLVGEELGL
jgi:hypothetical protein